MRGFLGLALATGIVFLATPGVIRVAARFDLIDRPVGYKGHAAPTPYLGGAPVVAAFIAVLLLLTGDSSRTLPIGVGVLVLCALGTFDDRRPVPPAVRVTVEALMAALLVAAGVGWHVGGGVVVDLLVTIAWVVAVVNALNLFDNMDGTAASMALVISAALVAIGLARGDVWLVVAAAGLAGCCLGFLPHNLAKPARIFLGDGGSMPIGFAIAAMAMIGASDEVHGWRGLAVGLLLVGVPALDTSLVIASRRRRGVSILTAGLDHLTHRTLGRLRTARAVAIALGMSQALLAALALVVARQSSTALVLAVALYLVGAATAIVLLDKEAPTRANQPAPVAVPAALGTSKIETALIVVLGAGAGISPFFEGFYHSGTWVPIGLVMLVLATAAAVAGAARISRAGLVAVGALAALGLLSLLSSSWSGSAEGAVVNGNRLLAYAAFLALLLALVRSRRDAAVAVGAFAAAALVVGLVEIARLLSADTSGMFVGGRLNEPLGYINGQGNFLLLAAWPCAAAALQRRRPWLAAAGAGAATGLAALALLAQSRGVILAGFVSVVAVLVVVPHRLRTAALLAALAAGVGAAAPTLVHVYTRATPADVSDSTARAAGLAVMLAAVAVALVWRAGLALEARLRRRGDAGVGRARLAVAAALGALVLAGCAGVAVKAGTIADQARTQYDAFVHLDPTQGGEGSHGRLVSGGGNRFDYWRVAANAWSGHPIAGIGAGSYPEPYFRTRRTTEDIRQPHSVEMEVLAELGLIGGLLLLAGGGVVAVAALRRRAGARVAPAERCLLVAGVGMTVAWGTQTSVDWMHLLPGLTAAALIGAAVLLRPREGELEPRTMGRAHLTGFLVVGVVVAIAATSLSRQLLADYTRSRGQDALAASPRDALKWANRSLGVDPDAPETYYLKAAAVARFGDGAGAEASLKQAISREPGNFLSYALLGDIYSREGRTRDARLAYREALRLNPRDVTLQMLARSG